MSAVATVPRFVGSALFPRRQLRAFLLTVRNGQLEFGHRTCADGHLPHRTGAGNPVTSTDVTRQCRNQDSPISLSQRCRDLGVCDRVNPSIEDQLAAIEAARKSAHWKRVRKQKLPPSTFKIEMQTTHHVPSCE